MGGHSSLKLLGALSSPSVAVSHLHVVVCTHADRDHAGGLTDLLDYKLSVQVDEFWLPGAWSDMLPGLLQNPKQVVDELVEELKGFVPDEKQDPDQNDDDNFESRVHARLADKRRETERDRRGNESRADPKWQADAAGLEWLKEQAANLDIDAANDAASAKAFSRGRRLVRYHASKMVLDRQWVAFWVSLIDTAERIRKIAVQAIRHNVKVRWFDFGGFFKTRQAFGGQPGLLVPLNSVELVVPPPPVGGLMSYVARLTPINEECLVFMSPGHWPDELGVVFTGDSPLGNGPGYSQTWLNVPQKSWQRVVATAPHHGSESNAMAYNHLTKMVHVVLWLRSGGSSKHPGPTFRGLPPAMRACTHCPHQMFDRGIAEVQLSNFWCIFRVRAHYCNC